MDSILAEYEICGHLAASDAVFCLTPTTSPSCRQPKAIAFKHRIPHPEEQTSLSSISHLHQMERILTGFTSFASSCPVYFCLSPLFNSSAYLTSDKRTVTRFRDEPVVQLSKPLVVNKKIFLQVDGSLDVSHGSAFLLIVKHSFDGETVYEKEIPQITSSGTTISLELTSGKKLIIIKIHSPGAYKVMNLFTTENSATKDLFLALKLTGGVNRLTVVRDDSSHSSVPSIRKFKDPIHRRPNVSTGQPLLPLPLKPRSDSPSSAYSSLETTPPPPKQQLVHGATGDPSDHRNMRMIPDQENAIPPAVQKESLLVKSPADVSTPPVLESAPNACKSGGELPVPQSQDVSPVAQNEKKVHRKWFSNQFMSCKDSIITRIRSGIDKNYIFSNELHVNQSLILKVLDVDLGPDDNAAVRLGVTTTPLLQVDFGKLPVDPLELMKCHNPADGRIIWSLSPNLICCVGAFDGLIFTRTSNCILMSIESGESMELMTEFDESEVLFPFVHMSGIVRTVAVLTP